MTDDMTWMVLAAALVAVHVVAGIPMKVKEVQNDDSFSRFDVNNDGVITESDVKRFGFKWSQVADFDLNYDNKLTREEFRILEQVGNKENGLQESSYLNHFRRADTNHDAQLTAEELQKHYKALGYNYPLSTFTNTIREKDQNGDGKLGYQEFREAIKG